MKKRTRHNSENDSKTDRHARGFFELEPLIRNLEMTADITFDKVMDVGRGDRENNMAVMMMTRLYRMAEDLRKEYDRFC